MAFTYPQRVRFQHCDPAGIVFFPRYFEMVNATVEEWFATRLDLPFSEMHGPTRGGVPTATIRADFTAPSRLGEMLDWTLVPLRLGRSSCELRLRASCAGQLRVEVSQMLVWIDMDSGRSPPWPEALRARIAQDIDIEGKTT
jgi:4-hydroxybenzoyl-CoA thioesterase